MLMDIHELICICFSMVHVVMKNLEKSCLFVYFFFNLGHSIRDNSSSFGSSLRPLQFYRLISRSGEVMEIFKNVKSHGKWKYTIKNDIPRDILIHMQQALCMSRLVLKDHGSS